MPYRLTDTAVTSDGHRERHAIVTDEVGDRLIAQGHGHKLVRLPHDVDLCPDECPCRAQAAAAAAEADAAATPPTKRPGDDASAAAAKE